MPTYKYRDTETGREWEEFRTMSQRLDGVDGEKIIQVPGMTGSPMNQEAAQRHADHDRFQRDTLAPMCETWRGGYDSNM